MDRTSFGSLLSLCDKQEALAQYKPFVAEELWKSLFCLGEIVTAISVFFFLAVPKTKILATGGASHNRDILQVCVGSRPSSRASSMSVTSKSQTLSNKDCLCSPSCRCLTVRLSHHGALSVLLGH